MSFNRLVELPESVTELPALRELQVNGNELTALPDTMGSLKRSPIWMLPVTRSRRCQRASASGALCDVHGNARGFDLIVIS